MTGLGHQGNSEKGFGQSSSRFVDFFSRPGAWGLYYLAGAFTCGLIPLTLALCLRGKTHVTATLHAWQAFVWSFGAGILAAVLHLVVCNGALLLAIFGQPVAVDNGGILLLATWLGVFGLNLCANCWAAYRVSRYGEFEFPAIGKPLFDRVRRGVGDQARLSERGLAGISHVGGAVTFGLAALAMARWARGKNQDLVQSHAEQAARWNAWTWAAAVAVWLLCYIEVLAIICMPVPDGFRDVALSLWSIGLVAPHMILLVNLGWNLIILWRVLTGQEGSG